MGVNICVGIVKKSMKHAISTHLLKKVMPIF